MSNYNNDNTNKSINCDVSVENLCAIKQSDTTILHNAITDGKLFSSLIRFAIPLMLAILVQALYSVVDLIIVGQFGTSASVSAVSIGGQMMHTITVIISGITMGGTVVIGRYFGAKNYVRCSKTIGNISFISLIMAVILTALTIGLAGILGKVMNVPQEAFKQYTNYVMICGSGVFFIVGYNLFGAIFRGIGNSKLPFYIILCASIINVVLDLIFVGLLKLDAIGAAVATVIAQVASVAISAIIIKKKKMPIVIAKKDFKPQKSVIKELLRIGSPLALQDGLTSISFLIISAFINTLGVVASASVGIAERMYLFLIIVPMAFMSTTATFVTQNIGAGKPQRALKSFYISMAISSTCGVIICLVTYFGGKTLAGLFTTDMAVIASSADYLRACAFEYIFTGIFYAFSGYFNGRGKTAFTMASGIIVAFGVRVPLSYVFTHMEEVTMFKIGTAVPISAAVCTVLCLVYFIALKIMDKKHAKNNFCIE